MSYKAYCINLSSSINRKNRMMERFNYHDLTVTFSPAVYKNATIVTKFINNDNATDYDKGVGACFMSHYNVMRKFIMKDSEDYLLVFEDDTLLHNDFKFRLAQLINNWPTYNDSLCDCVSLGYMLSSILEDRKYTDNTWGMQSYIMSRNGVLQALKYISTNDYIAGRCPENILQNINTTIHVPALVIEDLIDSDRDERNIPYHAKHFCFWDYKNFSDCDISQDSIVKNHPPSEAWSTYANLVNDNGFTLA